MDSQSVLDLIEAILAYVGFESAAFYFEFTVLCIHQLVLFGYHFNMYTLTEGCPFLVECF